VSITLLATRAGWTRISASQAARQELPPARRRLKFVHPNCWVLRYGSSSAAQRSNADSGIVGGPGIDPPRQEPRGARSAYRLDRRTQLNPAERRGERKIRAAPPNRRDRRTQLNPAQRRGKRKIRAAHTPPIDRIDGYYSILHSDGATGKTAWAFNTYHRRGREVGKSPEDYCIVL
jgi:hypothetical protein